MELKQYYDSDSDDILHDFYILALSNSIKYQRIAGFFSSNVLAIAAKGMIQFIKNNGTMELIVGAVLRSDDVDAIRAGKQTPEQVIEKSMLNELGNITEDFIKDHVKALGWMISQKLLDIKVVIPLEENGFPTENSSSIAKGLFHQKVGVLVDANNDIVTFSGSVNETAAGWLHNLEEFKVFRSWMDSERPYLESDLSKVQKFLSGKSKNALVIDIPSAVKQNLIRMAPADINKIDLNRYYQKFSTREAKKHLRTYQSDAIMEWKKKGHHGIAEMATGTGKTFFSLNAIEREITQNVLTVIGVPYDILAEQWKLSIQDEFPNALIVVCNSQNPKWSNTLSIIADYTRNSNDQRRIFVIATYHTASSDRFLNIISKIPSNKLCLIADEVHHLGATKFSKLVEINFRYRLGLSATPGRPWDEEGEAKIDNFFGGKVSIYSIDEALKDKVLCPYEYHINFITLEPDELALYQDLSQEIQTKVLRAKKLHPQLSAMSFPQFFSQLSRIDFQIFSAIQILLFRRVNILKTARGKRQALVNIIKNNLLKRCLVYCNDTNHLTEVLHTMDELGISALRYDSSMTSEERKTNLNAFADGHADFLVAVKCLDEGVDLPVCDSAILISSSKSEREFIQRRGRLLRKHPTKERAFIYDIIVLPVDPNLSNNSISETDYRIIENETERIKVFATSALNKEQVLLEINKMEIELTSRMEI